MATLHMTEAELVKNITDVLAKVREGAEVVVEQGYRPIAVIRPAQRFGRPISECIASAKASGSNVALDERFARDVEEGIIARQQLPFWN